MEKIRTSENVLKMIVSESTLMITEMVFKTQFLDLSTLKINSTFEFNYVIHANGFLYDQ